MPLIVGFRAFLAFGISWTLVLWYFNTSSLSADASVDGGNSNNSVNGLTAGKLLFLKATKYFKF